MACEREWADVERAESRQERTAALRRYRSCLLKNLAIQAGRGSHASAWDERMYEHYKFLEEAWEALFGVIRPLPGPGDPRTRKLRDQLSARPERIMALSHAIAKALDGAEIELGGDETFACLMFVMDKPAFASELIAAPAVDAEERPLPRVHAVVEPGVMKQVMEALERDRLE